ncbi:TetR/AcrR family transcriptional regulator [Hippea sp. KM1]|uniref:TetR/AcrR family transcriptional regulator n=1 Tax=Hippea sp. KM1 TaxID=944481 RepID=UPI00046D325E|nr:TetR/AcrR family transcriptional regulator [Hippea sp. KM1]
MTKSSLILKVAKELFTQKGFKATTMDEIAKRAKINKALIYYYFKDKNTLYSEIFRISLNEILSTIKQIDPQKPLDAFFTYIKAFCQFAEKDSGFFAMLMGELSTSAKHMPQLALEMFLQAVGILNEILKEGKRIGVFREVNTLTIHLTIIGTISFIVCSREIRNDTERIKKAPQFLKKEPESLCREIYLTITEGIKNESI